MDTNNDPRLKTKDQGQMAKHALSQGWDDSRLGWLGCAWYEKFGPKSLGRLQHLFGEGGGAKAWESKLDDLLRAGINEQAAQDFLVWRSKTDPNGLKDRLAADGIDFVLAWDKSYPSAFRQSSTPPFALFWRGAAVDQRPWIAVVGTRRMSAYGRRACEKIVQELVQAGAGIVSGMALGIDGCAHQTTLDNGGKTVAVLAGGIDSPTLYPRNNVPIAESILLSQGALISEFPPGTPHLKHHFPQRNRLIATLAKAVVVIEAGADSGSVLTAKLAVEENREVFAVPGPITSPGSVGVHGLLRQGAQLCTSGQDVLATATESVPKAMLDRPPTDEERKILDLCRTPSHIDELTRLLNSSAAVIGATCTTLEMAGAIQELENQTYQITAHGRQLLATENNVQR